MAQPVVPHMWVSLLFLTMGCFMPGCSLCLQWIFPQQLASQAVICSETPYISTKTWEKLCSVMDDTEFKHRLQANPGWQLHQQLMTLPKQKSEAQSLIPQGGNMPYIIASCHAKEWEQ